MEGTGFPGCAVAPRTWQKPDPAEMRGAELPEPFAGERGSPCADTRCSPWDGPARGGESVAGMAPALPFARRWALCPPARSGRAPAERCPAAGLARPCLLFCLLRREAEFMGLEVASPTERNTLSHSWEEYYWLL